MISSLFHKTKGNFAQIAVSFIMIFTLLVIAGNLLIPATSSLHIPTYFMSSLFGKYFCYALLAVALNMVWGYCGILSLGHAAFFALGGYVMGMYLTRQIGPRGVYGDPVLPDFMVFLNWKELPWFWFGLDNFWFCALLIMLVPGVLAYVFGWLAFRSRVSGVYFSIITQALTYALMLAFFRNDMGFGGNNGLNDFKDILGFSIQADSTRAALFFASAVFLSLGILSSAYLIKSRAGKVLIALRDGESRTRFLGYRVENYKLAVWTFSAILAGIAGALYVPQIGIINPSEFAPANSIEVVIWVAVGGRGTLLGPVIGAILVNFGKTWFTSVLPEFWLFALGALFVVVTLFLPKGLIGLIDKFKAHFGGDSLKPEDDANSLDIVEAKVGK
ncbi:urea ABC transporter permease subunit UrtC [Bartonella sp. HY328]|uniref:urea ABC transporter permease subunit UrtC n=1 Tax=unclassified Bartonella TaxID=2645622 RepID=UPI003965A9D4